MMKNTVMAIVLLGALLAAPVYAAVSKCCPHGACCGPKAECCK
jgi:hypothetical protein